MLKDLNDQIATLRDNINYVQDNINECQTSIVQMEENKVGIAYVGRVQWQGLSQIRIAISLWQGALSLSRC